MQQRRLIARARTQPFFGRLVATRHCNLLVAFSFQKYFFAVSALSLVFDRMQMLGRQIGQAVPTKGRRLVAVPPTKRGHGARSLVVVASLTRRPEDEAMGGKLLMNSMEDEAASAGAGEQRFRCKVDPEARPSRRRPKWAGGVGLGAFKMFWAPCAGSQGQILRASSCRPGMPGGIRSINAQRGHIRQDSGDLGISMQTADCARQAVSLNPVAWGALSCPEPRRASGT